MNFVSMICGGAANVCLFSAMLVLMIRPPEKVGLCA